MTRIILTTAVLRAASALLLIAALAALPAAAAQAPAQSPSKTPGKTSSQTPARNHAPTHARGTAGVVNVNTATPQQLALLPRVGPSIARRIVDLRKSNGSFKGPEDLMLVRGIGESTFALIKDYVVVKGETTLKTKVRVHRHPSGGGQR